MAVNILKAGKVKSALLRTRCKHCGCQFEFTQKDGRFSPGGQREPEDLIFVKCPQKGCGEEIIYVCK